VFGVPEARNEEVMGGDDTGAHDLQASRFATGQFSSVAVSGSRERLLAPSRRSPGSRFCNVASSVGRLRAAPGKRLLVSPWLSVFVRND
jgi:hypothetical protein